MDAKQKKKRGQHATKYGCMKTCCIDLTDTGLYLYITVTVIFMMVAKMLKISTPVAFLNDRSICFSLSNDSTNRTLLSFGV